MKEKVEEYDEVILNLTETHANEMSELHKQYNTTRKKMTEMAPTSLQIKKR